MMRLISLVFLSLTVLGSAPRALAHDEDPVSTGRAPEKLGTVKFATSCGPKVQAQFERGVALLHSFWFNVGLSAFNDVLKADPECAIAYWGIAVNRLLNPFGGEPGAKFLAEGAAAVEKGQAAGAKTQRERDYIDAVAELYKDAASVPWRRRVLAYEKAMAELVARYPDDMEAVIFYALALNIAHDPGDKTYAKPLKAAALLEPLFPGHPDHPGIAHFLIHSYDFPPLAEKGLVAARRYADIAPSAPHALHMPSHIFTRVGAWQDSVATNQRSEREARREGGGVDGALHAMDYQVYAYLQLGRDADAKRTLERAAADAPRASVRPAGPYSLAAVPARYALERGDWHTAAQLALRPSPVLQANAITHFARAIGAARSGDPAAAHADLDALTALHDKLTSRKVAYWAQQVEILRLGATAWVALAEGRKDEAATLMRQAADLEERSEKAPISPGPVLPARELLGDMLLELGQPAAALKEYEASQAREPNRFRGYYGAAVAAAAAGDMAKAKANAAKLMELAGTNGSRPELKKVKQYLAQN